MQNELNRKNIKIDLKINRGRTKVLFKHKQVPEKQLKHNSVRNQIIKLEKDQKNEIKEHND